VIAAAMTCSGAFSTPRRLGAATSPAGTLVSPGAPSGTALATRCHRSSLTRP
jgi:hypothetical protein